MDDTSSFQQAGLALSLSRTPGLSPRNLTSHVRPAVVVAGDEQGGDVVLELRVGQLVVVVGGDVLHQEGLRRKSSRTSPPPPPPPGDHRVQHRVHPVPRLEPTVERLSPGASAAGRDEKEAEMTLKLARNSSPSGSELISMFAITFNAN
jgi:hypothetical protein